MSEAQESQNPLSESVIPCQECSAGLMHLRYITYFTWLNSELVTVPNFPAWICDVCGRRSFDSRAIIWLNTLLSPAAGKTARQVERPHLPASPAPPQP